MRLTDAALDELWRLDREATKGPWRYDGMHPEITGPNCEWLVFSECRASADVEPKIVRDQFGHGRDPNFDLIKTARNSLAPLLAELRAARRVVEAARPDEHGNVNEDALDAALSVYDALDGAKEAKP